MAQQPTSASVHLDQILTNISIQYMQAAGNFVAGQVFPRVPVDKQSDKYYIFDKNAFMRDQMKKRAPGTESAGSGYTLSRDSYYCDVFSLHKDIDNQTRQNTDNPLDPDRNATNWLSMQKMIRQEIQFNTDMMTTGVWGTDKVGGTDFTQWSNYTASDPINDIEAGKEAILSVTGFEPNTLVLSYSGFRQLKNHPDIRDYFKYTGSKVVTAEMLAGLFDLQRVLVSKAVKATNLENETAAYAFATSKNALLCYSAPAPGLEVASAGYTFEWTGVSEGLGETVGISRFYIPRLKSDRIEIEAAWDNKVVATDLAYFFSSCVA